MKYLTGSILTLLLICFTLPASGISSYTKEDTLYVWAEGSLVIRDTSNANGHKISSVPYGKSVQVLESKLFDFYQDSIQISQAWSDQDGQHYNAVYLRGFWVKVSFNGLIGYVFDGYLSHFPAPILQKNGENEDIAEYIMRIFGVPEKKNTRGEDFFIKDDYFKKGVSSKAIGSKTAYKRYILPDLSLEEAILFIKNTQMTHENGKMRLIKQQSVPLGTVLKFKYDQNGDGELYIYQIGDMIVIATYSWC